MACWVGGFEVSGCGSSGIGSGVMAVVGVAVEGGWRGKVDVGPDGLGISILPCLLPLRVFSFCYILSFGGRRPCIQDVYIHIFVSPCV